MFGAITFNQDWAEASLILIDCIHPASDPMCWIHTGARCLNYTWPFSTAFSQEGKKGSGLYLLCPGTLRHADEIRIPVKTDVNLMRCSYWLTSWLMTSLLIWIYTWTLCGGVTTMVGLQPKAGCQARLHLATLNEPTAHFLSLPAIHHHTVTGKFIWAGKRS